MPFDPEQEKAERMERMRQAGMKGRVSSGAKRGGAVRRKAGYRMAAYVEPSERALMIREGEKEKGPNG